MATKLRVTAPHRLTISEIRTLRRLSMRENGNLYYDLQDLRYDVRAKVFMVTDEAGTVLSWALVQPNVFGENDFQVYTRKSERRKGHATRLFRQAHKRYGELVTHKHDPKSTGFFDHMEAQVKR